MADTELTVKALRGLMGECMELLAKGLELAEGMPEADLEDNIEARRELVVAYLDYIAAGHDGSDEYAAGRIGIKVHAIKDEWRVPGKDRSLPGGAAMFALERLCLEEIGRREER